MPFTYKRSDDDDQTLDLNDDGEPVIIDDKGKETTLGKLVRGLRKESGDRRRELRDLEESVEPLQAIGKILEEAELDETGLRRLVERSKADPNGKSAEELAEELEAAKDRAEKAESSAAAKVLEIGLERDSEKVARAFAESEAVGETVYLPDHAREIWGSKIVRDKEGRVRFSDDGKTPLLLDAEGHEAPLDEALRSIFAADPKADRYHKPTADGGTGLKDDGEGNGKPKGGLSRSKMSTRERAAYLRQHGREAYDRLPR